MIDQLLSIDDLSALLHWEALLYLAVALLLILAAKALNHLTAGYQLDRELTTQDNPAVAVSFGGFLLAVALIIHGIFTSPYMSLGWQLDLLYTVIWAGLGCLLLLGSRWIQDKLLLPWFSNRKELVTDRNVGIGAVQAGGYIGTALIIRALVMDESTAPLWTEIALTLMWYACTQAVFLLFARVYARLISYSLRAELERDNVAAGVSFGGSLIALGILLAFYLQGSDSLVGFGLWAILAIIILKLTRLLTDKLILPHHRLDSEIQADQNWGAGCIEAIISICVALFITGSLF